MRIVLVGFVVVLLVLCCVLAIRYGQDASYAYEKLDAERYERMVSEENLQKANVQISSLAAELKRAQDKLKKADVVLRKNKIINEDLKRRLDKASKIKENLDKKIDELRSLVLPM